MTSPQITISVEMKTKICSDFENFLNRYFTVPVFDNSNPSNVNEINASLQLMHSAIAEIYELIRKRRLELIQCNTNLQKFNMDSSQIAQQNNAVPQQKQNEPTEQQNDIQVKNVDNSTEKKPRKKNKSSPKKKEKDINLPTSQTVTTVLHNPLEEREVDNDSDNRSSKKKKQSSVQLKESDSPRVSRKTTSKLSADDDTQNVKTKTKTKTKKTQEE